MCLKSLIRGHGWATGSKGECNLIKEGVLAKRIILTTCDASHVRLLPVTCSVFYWHNVKMIGNALYWSRLLTQMGRSSVFC